MTEVLTDRELVVLSHGRGVNVGQIALCEYLLKSYKGQMSTQMEDFLSKVAQESYEKASENLDKPAEDIALQVTQILDRIVK